MKTTTETVAIKQKWLDWLGAAPIAWEGLVNDLNIVQRQELSRWLDGIAEGAARLSGYLDGRGVLGCDDTHAGGVKQSNRKAARVRKALGYTVYRQDLSF